MSDRIVEKEADNVESALSLWRNWLAEANGHNERLKEAKAAHQQDYKAAKQRLEGMATLDVPKVARLTATLEQIRNKTAEATLPAAHRGTETDMAESEQKYVQCHAAIRAELEQMRAREIAAADVEVEMQKLHVELENVREQKDAHALAAQELLNGIRRQTAVKCNEMESVLQAKQKMQNEKNKLIDELHEYQSKKLIASLLR